MNSATGEKRLTGRGVLIIFLSFFGVIFVVNFVMAYLATDTFPGLVVKSSYVASQTYDAERDAQEALGWSAAMELIDGALLVSITDRDGAPVHGLAISAIIGRPATTKGERIVDLTQSGDVYLARPGLPKGIWRVEIRATGGPEENFRAQAKLFEPGRQG